ncbi:MAG: hypothetical protein A2X86_08865 [Bdellovibrionales bacterium GWA2_49_15]|nr:MAG: hypothetical protein A2X86_08865 [Bdellovibrionales bacterium GWA2_49_15]HAZ12888.1 hypothetical protein [Bdellovibrionales bacterium]
MPFPKAKLLGLIVLMALSGCQKFDLGVAIGPRHQGMGPSDQDWIEHYTDTTHGARKSFHLNWRDAIETAGEIPANAHQAMQAAAQFGVRPVIGFGWSNGAGNPDLTSTSDPDNNSFTNQDTRQDFRAMVTAFAAQYHPAYLFLGNETNSYFVTHTQAEWLAWVSLFEECYDGIKAVSPTTLVYTVFQLEKMKGLGKNAGWIFPIHWQLIQDHLKNGKIDAVGFTSYPYFEYQTVAQIPADYFSMLTAKLGGKSMILSETAWPAEARGPYPGSPTEQASYVNTLFARLQNMNIAYVAWLFEYDLGGSDVNDTFHKIGFKSNDGATIRPSDAAWKSKVQQLQK